MNLLALSPDRGWPPASIPLRKTLLSQPSAPGPTQPRRRRPGEAFLKTRLDRGNGALTYHLNLQDPADATLSSVHFLKNNRQTHIEISRFGLYSRFAHHGETGSCRKVRVPMQQPTTKALLPSTRDMCLGGCRSQLARGRGEKKEGGLGRWTCSCSESTQLHVYFTTTVEPQKLLFSFGLSLIIRDIITPRKRCFFLPLSLPLSPSRCVRRRQQLSAISSSTRSIDSVLHLRRNSRETVCVVAPELLGSGFLSFFSSQFRSIFLIRVLLQR